MSKMELSEEQRRIVEYEKNIVIIANPGSGKTFVVCEKIKYILPQLLEYEGVIAISYTNKASDELKNRLRNINIKASNFNTLDTFLLMEIIYSFGEHVFGNSKYEFQIYDTKDTSSEAVNRIRKLDFKTSQEYIDALGDVFIEGKILLESISELAIYIIEKSDACKKYLKARYKYIFIDEYQDCGESQHNIFLKIVSLGICGIAVGDPNQSIYGFSGKSSKYLLELTNNDNFKTFYLNANYRSHEAIVDYSLKLLDKEYKIISNECRVFYKKVNGTQKDIAMYIDENIDKYINMYSLQYYNQVAILVRNDTTGKLIDSNLKSKHKYMITTELDKNFSLWGSIFKKLLIFKINNGNAYEFVEQFFDEDDKKFKIIYNALEKLRDNKNNLNEYKDIFVKIAKLIYPMAFNQESVELLERILNNRILYESYKEAEKDEIQIMTLHKSKGLEFKVVFHLDLYKYIMPSEGICKNGIWGYTDFNQCLNLHYVGITRAIDTCILITSTLRYNGDGIIKQGIDSDFLIRNGLNGLRNRYNNLDEIAITK